MTTDLLAQARVGDGEAFRQLTDPYRRELQVHCYRMLGSACDAEDALQETLIAAWRALADFEGRASVRTWLYRIATNRCLNALRSASRQPQMEHPILDLDPPEPTRLGEVVWLEPYPDVLLDGLADQTPGPEARYEATQAISLAFVTALQLLPPRQRAVVVLRDVLGFPAAQVATILDTTTESVTSALKRARSTLDRRAAHGGHLEDPPAPGSAAEDEMVERLTRAYTAGDLAGLVALLSEDVILRMPPTPFEYQGRDVAARFLAVVAFQPGRTFRLVPTRANRQPAFGVYVKDPQADILRATGLLVVTLAGRSISALTRFDNSVLTRFGLPRTLSE